MTHAVNIAELQRDGITMVPLGLGEAQATDIREFLMTRPCYPGHVKTYGDGVARSFETIRDEFDVSCHDMQDVMMAPHIWDLIISLTPVAARYLGVSPHLYSMNAFWTRPSARAAQPDIQEFHRDADDDRFLVMFVYGSDAVTSRYWDRLARYFWLTPVACIVG
jgi:hypothetical protein